MSTPVRWRGLRPWRPLLGALLVGVALVWIAVRLERRLDADGAELGARVEGCGAACADAWERALGERLERAGLSVTSDPPAGAPVIVLHMETKEEVEGVEAGDVLLRAEVLLTLEGESASPLSLEAEGANREDALLSIALAALDARADALVAELLAQPELAEPAAVRSLTRADALRRALRDLPGHAEDEAAFLARCAEDAAAAAPEGDRVSCSTSCAGEVSVVRTAEGSAVVQRRPAAWALPLDSSHDVQRVDLTGGLLPQAFGDGGVGSVVIGSRVSEAVGSGHGRFAFVAYHERASAVVLVGEGRRVLARARAPRVLASPAPSPSGRWVAYLAAEHRRGVPHLRVVPAAGGASRDLSNYVEALRWVRLGDRELLLARVSGAELATSPLAQAAEAGGSDGAGGGDGGDDGADFEDEEDDFDLVEPGDPEAPPGAYAALVDPEDGSVLARVAGRERVVTDVVGVSGRELVLTYRQAGDGGCGLLWHDLDSGDERTLPLEVCLEDPVLLSDGRVAASAPVTGPGDPAAGDREIVLVSDAGELSALTANATDDLTPSPLGASELAFTRLMPKRYTRFPVSAACRVLVPPRASSTDAAL